MPEGWRLVLPGVSVTVAGIRVLPVAAGGSGFRRVLDGGVGAMVGSLTISYGRKRNVGGRVLRNFERSSTDTLADTFREKI